MPFPSYRRPSSTRCGAAGSAFSISFDLPTSRLSSMKTLENSKSPWPSSWPTWRLGGFLFCLLVFIDGPARAADATLAVDASQVVSGLPRPWAAAVGTGTASLTLRTDLQTHFKIVHRELGMQRVRGHGILNDDIGVFQWTGGSAALTYSWTKLDRVLQAYAAAGMRPIMELSFMPTALARPGDAGAISNRNPPSDLTVYRQFIQAVVQ